uniref:Similar to CG32816 n=1 Tax=Papilio xuthus TaxID=66420 RepID=I4DLC4_PAPXU|nr:uncharacterized protein LOC106121975 precursor [Papilio xuthus]BAM18714.1 similar to CG32816 [Papilio xuthus]
MGVSAKLIILLFTFSVAFSIPVGDHSTAFSIKDDAEDLAAESSEIISKAVLPPQHYRETEKDQRQAASETDHSIDVVGDSQNFFPSFANLFEPRQQNNYRASFGNQEAAYSQRPNSFRSLLNYPIFGGFNRNVETFGKQSAVSSAPLIDTSPSVLGSGNFGIIRGGTFFAQNDEDHDFGDSFSSYYNNGHGRPSTGVGYIANPKPNYNQDQFANFRDFADINAPSNSAYSHYVVVYANKNGTMDEISEETRNVVSEPRNIIETLERLDDIKIPVKISKSKAKLEATKQKMVSKKDQWKKTNSKYINQKHEIEEPLLALS